MDNFAAVLHGLLDVRIEKLPVPKVNENEVLVKMSCVGVCGSDVKMYSTGRSGAHTLLEPVLMGHEGAGVIVQVGSNVTSLKPGDRVSVEPAQPCRRCESCKRGRYNLCATARYCSTRGAEGNLSYYYKHVADYCHKIPDNLTMEEGAAVQPLAVAIHACNRAGIKLGDIVVILGAGPVGVLCAMAARAMGAGKILMTDVLESRLDVAKQMAADATVLIKTEYSDQDAVELIEQQLGAKPDVTIDGCGFASAQRIALMVTKSGGVAMIVGIGGPTVELPLTAALLREVDIRGAYRIANTYPAAIEAVSNGRINLKKFITHRFPMAKTKEALDLAKSGDAMKIVINIPE